jgi:thymidylate kinase
MLKLVSDLFVSLDREGIRYCHWKSNLRLEAALQGEDDLDLLVHPEHRERFQDVLAAQGFKRTSDGGTTDRHHIGMDWDSGTIIHVDVLYAITTGGRLLKSHDFPVVDQVLDSRRRTGIVPVPSATAELALLLVRKALEASDWMEHPLVLRRELEEVRSELRWLLKQTSIVDAEQLVATWFQAQGVGLSQFARALLNGSGWQRYRSGRRVSKALGGYRRFHPLSARIRRIHHAVESVFRRRILRRPRRRRLPGGGRLIAVVGTDGSGKSTLVGELQRWLDPHVKVIRIHAGKPPRSLMSLATRGSLRLATGEFGFSSPTRTKSGWVGRNPAAQSTLADRIRSFLDAKDRTRLLHSATELAQNGAVVVCDRFPSLAPGGMDGPSIAPDDLSLNGFTRWLSRNELEAYQSMPVPSLVIALHVSPEEAVARNSARQGNDEVEPEEYILERRSIFLGSEFPHGVTSHLPSDVPFSETLLQAKRLVWAVL